MTVDDETVLTAVEELARFKRAIVFLQNAIKSMDLELVPKSIWDSFNQQCSPCLDQMRTYAANRNLSHLQSANQHVDNLLSYVRPYLILPERAIDVLASATTSYRTSLEENLISFTTKSKSKATEITEYRDRSKEAYSLIVSNTEKVNTLVKKLIGDTPTDESVERLLFDLKSKVDQQASEIENLHKQLLVDENESTSVASQIESTKAEIIEASNQISLLLANSQQKIFELKAFHQKVYGGTVDSEGNPEEGLEQELNERIAQLDKLEIEQISKYDTLHQKIESLLPGATSAGLARAYQELRRSFARPIRANTKLFYWAVGLIPAVALVGSIQSFQLSPFELQITDYQDIGAILKNMLVKLPIIAPLVWLAIFASTRRSQYERLQQEYAHKEALAKSYDSYKKQLEALLAADSEPLQIELLKKAIDAISFNASATLDGKHQEKLPIENALDFLSGEKGKSILERLRKLWS